MYALNLPLSPESYEFWVSFADTFCVVAGHAVDTLTMSIYRPPGVSDSIEPLNDVGATRHEKSFLAAQATEYGVST